MLDRDRVAIVHELSRDFKKGRDTFGQVKTVRLDMSMRRQNLERSSIRRTSEPDARLIALAQESNMRIRAIGRDAVLEPMVSWDAGLGSGVDDNSVIGEHKHSCTQLGQAPLPRVDCDAVFPRWAGGLRPSEGSFL